MRKTKLRNVKDGQKFKLSTRSKIFYKMIKKEFGQAIFTSLSSELSFIRSTATTCYV